MSTSSQQDVKTGSDPAPNERQTAFHQTSVTGLTGKFSHRYKFEEIPSQSGKTAIVTGGSAGIGANIAYGLTLAGARVIITGATEEHCAETCKIIREEVDRMGSNTSETSPGSVEYRVLDQGNLKEVEKFASSMLEELKIGKISSKQDQSEKSFTNEDKSRQGGLYLLINNAGVGVAPGGDTLDGLGNHFQINHLSHMLLTLKLLPLMEETQNLPSTKAGDVRVVFQSSELHRAAPSDVKFDSAEEMASDADPTKLYGRSKLMKQLAKRKLKPDGNKVIAIAVHPGAVATGQEEGAAESYGLLGKALVHLSKLFFMGADQGSESALWAATAPQVGERPEDYQGSYLRQPDDSLGSESKQAQDESLGNNLWSLSTRVLLEKLSYQAPI